MIKCDEYIGVSKKYINEVSDFLWDTNTKGKQ